MSDERRTTNKRRAGWMGDENEREELRSRGTTCSAWVEQGLGARKGAGHVDGAGVACEEGGAGQRTEKLSGTLEQEIKVSETIRKRLFGTLPNAESAKAREQNRNYPFIQKSKQSLNEPAEKSQRYKEEQISLGNEATSCSGRCTLPKNLKLSGKASKRVLGTLQKTSKWHPNWCPDTLREESCPRTRFGSPNRLFFF